MLPGSILYLHHQLSVSSVTMVTDYFFGLDTFSYQYRPSLIIEV